MINEADRKLVERVARRLAGTIVNADFDDLCQVGHIALWQAADKIPTDEKHAGAYKMLRVRGAMIDLVRKDSWAPRSTHKDEDRHSIVSIDERDDENGWAAHDFATEDNSDERVIMRDRQRVFERVLDELSTRDRQIVELILKGQSMDEVAAEFGLTKSRISQIVNSIAASFDDKYEPPAPKPRRSKKEPEMAGRGRKRWDYGTNAWAC